MSELTYPTWADVGLPPSMVKTIASLDRGPAMDYLLLNRVFRFPVKAQYVYFCDQCSHKKKVNRIYEDYSSCAKCGGHCISSSANWRMGKDKMEPFSQDERELGRVIKAVGVAYAAYFRQPLPEDFFQSKLDFDFKKCPPAFRYKKDNDIYNNPVLTSSATYFIAKFAGGDQVRGRQQALTILRAALLCPYLWDELFDWRKLTKKGKGQETHIFPLLFLWNKLDSQNRNYGSEKETPTRKSLLKGKRQTYSARSAPMQEAFQWGTPSTSSSTLSLTSAMLHDIFGQERPVVNNNREAIASEMVANIMDSLQTGLVLD